MKQIQHAFLTVINIFIRFMHAYLLIYLAHDHREVHEEVNQAREKVSELKMRRQMQAEARREKLKQAYLRKQLDKLKAASGTEQE